MLPWPGITHRLRLGMTFSSWGFRQASIREERYSPLSPSTNIPPGGFPHCKIEQALSQKGVREPKSFLPHSPFSHTVLSPRHCVTCAGQKHQAPLGSWRPYWFFSPDQESLPGPSRCLRQTHSWDAALQLFTGEGHFVPRMSVLLIPLLIPLLVLYAPSFWNQDPI